MSPDEITELEALFARARHYPPAPSQWEQMLRAVPAPGRSHRRAWRIGLPLAAVAAIFGVAVILLAPPAHRAAFALTRVAEVLRTAPVVKCTSSNGWVLWEGHERFFASRSTDHEQYVYRDLPRETVATYDAVRGSIMISTSDRPAFPGGWTGAYTLDGLIREVESWGRAFAERWERTDRSENGRPVILLTSKPSAEAGRRILIDGESGRIDRVESGRDVTTYEYPEQAPRDLYDLGVPRDAPVIDGTAPPAVLALRAHVRAQAQQNAGAYRLIEASSVGGYGLFRVITDGRRYRVESLPFDDTREYTVAELRSVAAQYDHMGSLEAEVRSIYLFDENTETSVMFDENHNVRTRRVCPRWAGLARFHTLEARSQQVGDATAFFGYWPEQQCEALGPNAQGWVGFRIQGQANNCSRPYVQERWYDPEHEYLWCYGWGYDDPQAGWQLRSDWQTEYLRDRDPTKTPVDAPARGGDGEVLEWAELRLGLWYPAVRRNEQMERAPDGTWQLQREPDCENCHTVTYEVLVATALDSVADEWFQLPAEWEAVPAHDFH
jgi:hypothetical protein